MGYSFSVDKKLFNFDKNNLPYSKTLSDLLNDESYKNAIEDKKIQYLRPLQTSIISKNYTDLDFETKDEVLKWAEKNNLLCNYFAINQIKNDDWYFNFHKQFYSGGNYTSEYSGECL